MAPTCTTAPFADGVVCARSIGGPAGCAAFACGSIFEGRPRGKAAPANLFADPKAEVWGVLYRLTRRDLVRLDATEGIPWSWYRPLWLDAEDINGHPFRAMTYIAHGKEVDSRPSLRYIMLLRDGARSHGLPEHYIRVLEDVEAAQ